MGIKIGGIVNWVKAHKAKIAAAGGIVSGYVAHTLGLGEAIKALVDVFVK
jgi:hypothetical protein